MGRETSYVWGNGFSKICWGQKWVLEWERGGEGEKNQMYKRGREGKEVRMGSILPQLLKKNPKGSFLEIRFWWPFYTRKEEGEGGEV